MNTAFLECWKQVLRNEGGYSDNPMDSGGKTMWGVTKRVARANGYTGKMRDLPREKAMEIAKKCYWDPFGCDVLPVLVAFQVLDTAYNGGHPIQWLQKVVGVLDDGIMGPITLAAVQREDPWEVCYHYNAYRLRYYTSLKRWAFFGKGWTNRIANNLAWGGKGNELE